MYIALTEKTKFTAKAQKVVEICKAGGHVQYALERQYTGVYQYVVRVYDHNCCVVKGLGYKAAHDAIALGYLKRNHVARSNIMEWIAA
jgi:hypothetical protein